MKHTILQQILFLLGTRILLWYKVRTASSFLKTLHTGNRKEPAFLLNKTKERNSKYNNLSAETSRRLAYNTRGCGHFVSQHLTEILQHLHTILDIKLTASPCTALAYYK